MDITKVTKSGSFEAGALSARFSLTCKDGDRPVEVVGYLYKGFSMVGSFNAHRNGSFGLSFGEGNGLSAAERDSCVAPVMEAIALLLGEGGEETKRKEEQA